MKTKLPLLAILILACGVIVACGDNKDPRLTDTGAAYANQYGAACQANPANCNSGVTATQTVTVNQTN